MQQLDLGAQIVDAVAGPEDLSNWTANAGVALVRPGGRGASHTHAKKRNHIRQLEALGYRVTLKPAA